MNEKQIQKTLSSQVADLLELKTNLQKQINDIIAVSGQEVMQEIFAQVFAKHPGAKKFVIQGMTPAFNDGEPCVHRWEIYSGKTSKYNNYTWVDVSESDDEIQEFMEYDDDTKETVNKGCDTLDEFVNDLSMYVEIPEFIYETNFHIFVSLNEDGSVTVEHKDYYPEY